MRSRIVQLAAASAFLFASVLPTASASGRVGIGFQVDGDGFFLNPVVTRVLVTTVEAGSVAAAAGIVEGDRIIAVDGESIIGRRARDISHLTEFKPGEQRVLRLKHANDEEFEAKVTRPVD